MSRPKQQNSYVEHHTQNRMSFVLGLGRDITNAKVQIIKSELPQTQQALVSFLYRGKKKRSQPLTTARIHDCICIVGINVFFYNYERL